MKLPFSFNFNKKEESEYILVLLLKDEKASAIMVERLGGAIRVISSHEEYFKDSIEEAPPEELLDVLDKAISSAEESLPPQVEVRKTIFGVKEEWVEDNGIKKEYLAKLKQVSEALNLSPIGFLVITEAISHALQKEEGAPVSAIIVEVGKRHIGVSLLRAGRIIETHHEPIVDSVVKTTDKVLHNFTQYEILPSRIIISHSKSGESLLQEFISHAWSKTLPFLHVPQIMMLTKDFEAKAVLIGTATQMGLEITSEKAPEKEPVKQTPTKEEPMRLAPTPDDNFGFVTEKDIADYERQDIKVVDNREKEVSLERKTPVYEMVKKYALIVISVLLKGASILTKVFSMAYSPVRFNKLVFIPPVVVGIILLLIGLYIFVQKATVTLTVNPKVIEKNQPITIATSSSSDLAKNIIAGEFLEISEEGSTTTEATGTKETGDKAKGEVTIYNSDLSSSKSFTKGTIITSSNNLDFTLDNEVSLASASGDASSITPSSKKVSVTASDIGKEYNLPSGTKFTVDELDKAVVIAKNDSAFSGGSKKEVVVVSKEDIDKLTTQLSKELQSKAKENLSQKISQKTQIASSFVKETVSKKEFAPKEGQEAKNVTLTGTVLYQALSYKKDDVESFVNDLLKRDINDMTLDKNKITYEIKNLKLKDEDKVMATLFIKAFLIPKIKDDELKNSLSGKTFDDTNEILSKLPQVSNVDIALSPNLPFLPSLLPRLSHNITLVIESNE